MPQKIKIFRILSAYIVLSVLVTIVTTGCAVEPWQYTVKDTNGALNIIFDNRVQIIFEGLSFGSGDANGQIYVDGEVVQNSALTWGDLKITFHHLGKITSVTVNQYHLLIEDKGTAVSFGGRKYKIEPKKKFKLVVHADGTAAIGS